MISCDCYGVLKAFVIFFIDGLYCCCIVFSYNGNFLVEEQVIPVIVWKIFDRNFVIYGSDSDTLSKKFLLEKYFDLVKNNFWKCNWRIKKFKIFLESVVNIGFIICL